jgi:hypothetical protein
MATLLQALVGGVPTLVDSESVARETIADTNGTTPLTAGMYISAAGGAIAPADAPTAKFALGYVTASVLASAAFTYFTDGVNKLVTGLTKGAAQYLGASGASTTTPPEPASSGGWQKIGYANSATSAEFVPGLGYTRA